MGANREDKGIKEESARRALLDKFGLRCGAVVQKLFRCKAP